MIISMQAWTTWEFYAHHLELFNGSKMGQKCNESKFREMSLRPLQEWGGDLRAMHSVDSTMQPWGGVQRNEVAQTTSYFKTDP